MPMMPYKKKNLNYGKHSHGFTLVELIVSMAIGTVIIAGAMNLFITNSMASKNVLQMTHLNQEIRTVMEIMSADIRKAGFWGGALNAAPATPNPFGITSINGNQNCILFTYDVNNNSTVQSSDEEFGYRIKNNTIESRLNGRDCTINNSWDALSDNTQVEITALTFTTNIICSNVSDTPITNCTTGSTVYIQPNTGDVLVETHQINISLSGRLKSNTELNLSINDSIVVKNDSITVAP